MVHGFPPGIFRCRGNLPLHSSVGLEPLTHERICQIPGRPRRNLSNPDLVKNLVKSLGAPRNLTNLILSKILSNLPRKVMGPRRHCSITACAGGYQSLSNFIQLRLRPFSTALMTLPRQAAARSDLTARGRPAATHVHQSFLKHELTLFFGSVAIFALHAQKAVQRRTFLPVDSRRIGGAGS